MTTHGTRPMTSMEIYNDLPVVQPYRRIWMLDGKVYEIYSRDPAGGVVTLISKHDGKLYTVLWVDFMKNRKRVYNLPKTADLLNRHVVWLRRQIWWGNFFPPTYYTPDGKRDLESKARQSPCYNEDEIFKLRDIMIERRNYGKNGQQQATPYVPSVQELRRRMGLDILTYTKTTDGRFIPVWQADV